MAQIGYVTLGTNDLQSAVAFYGALLVGLGAKRYIETEQGVSWTFGPGTTSLSVVKPHNGQSATVGNGAMVAIGVTDRNEVDRAYTLALSLGALDEGTPGPRGRGSTPGIFATSTETS